MLNAIVVTLPKPGKDPTSPQNFCPISLLNVDVKIYAKLIANRLINILLKLIHKDQTGFTKGRQSSDATRRMIDIIHQVDNSGTPSVLLSLDAEKAFDRVHLGYLFSVLPKFGFTGQIHAINGSTLRSFCPSVLSRMVLDWDAPCPLSYLIS